MLGFLAVLDADKLSGQIPGSQNLQSRNLNKKQSAPTREFKSLPVMNVHWHD